MPELRSPPYVVTSLTDREEKIYEEEEDNDVDDPDDDDNDVDVDDDDEDDDDGFLSRPPQNAARARAFSPRPPSFLSPPRVRTTTKFRR